MCCHVWAFGRLFCLYSTSLSLCPGLCCSVYVLKVGRGGWALVVGVSSHTERKGSLYSRVGCYMVCIFRHMIQLSKVCSACNVRITPLCAHAYWTYKFTVSKTRF